MQSPALRARFLHERAKTNKYLGLITSELARLLSLSDENAQREGSPTEGFTFAALYDFSFCRYIRCRRNFYLITPRQLEWFSLRYGE